jgi:hypothetical protein
MITIAKTATSRTQSRARVVFLRTGIRTIASKPAPARPIQFNGAALATAVFAVVATVAVTLAAPVLLKSTV